MSSRTGESFKDTLLAALACFVLAAMLGVVAWWAWGGLEAANADLGDMNRRHSRRGSPQGFLGIAAVGSGILAIGAGLLGAWIPVYWAMKRR